MEKFTLESNDAEFAEIKKELSPKFLPRGIDPQSFNLISALFSEAGTSDNDELVEEHAKMIKKERDALMKKIDPIEPENELYLKVVEKAMVYLLQRWINIKNK